MRLDEFVENIDTECHQLGISTILNVKAIKVDGNGVNSLKYLLTQNSLKSCDYLKLRKTNLFFLEFSCLNSQLAHLNTVRSHINTSTIPSNVSNSKSFKKMYPQPMMFIENEISEKIAHSVILFSIILKNFNISNDSKRKKKFLIGICSSRMSDVQVFDSITRKLQLRYANVFERVAIIPYTQIEAILT